MKIAVDGTRMVSAMLHAAGYRRLLRHGARRGSWHAPSLQAAVADGLFTRGIATLRDQFPAMEQGLKWPDRPPLAHATVRAAVMAAASHASGLPSAESVPLRPKMALLSSH